MVDFNDYMPVKLLLPIDGNQYTQFSQRLDPPQNVNILLELLDPRNGPQPPPRSSIQNQKDRVEVLYGTLIHEERSHRR